MNTAQAECSASARKQKRVGHLSGHGKRKALVGLVPALGLITCLLEKQGPAELTISDGSD